MRHYTHSVNIPLDKNEVDLANEPKPIPWSHSSEESNCYINFYRSWLEVTFKVNINANPGSQILTLLKPHSCAISHIDGNMVFVSRDGTVLGSDFTESIRKESYYRTVLDNCFCNADKQMLDDYTPQYVGMQNIDIKTDTNSLEATSPFDNTLTFSGLKTGDNTLKIKIPMRLLVGFSARDAYLLVKNFQSKIYFNKYSYWMNRLGNQIIQSCKLTNIDAYYDQTITEADEDPFPESLLTIPQCKIETAYTPVACGTTNSENRVKFTDTINFKPKLVCIWFTDENDNLVKLRRSSPTFFKISTGSETNTNCSLEPDSDVNNPDYRLWTMTRNCLDMNNKPCLRYDVWKNRARYYLFDFAQNFNLVNNSNYINYELRFKNDDGQANETIHIHRAYLLDYLHNAVVEEESY